MSNPFKNRVFGCAIIKSINSNYNADFSHQPRTLPNGVVYATDKALKYTVRNYWKDFYPDEKVFYFKSLNEKLKPRTLDERYEQLFEKFKTNITSDNFSVFEFDGEKVIGILPSKPKPKDVKAPKDADSDNPLKTCEGTLKKIASKNIIEMKPEEVDITSFEVGENFYFFVNKNGNIEKISDEESVFRKAIDIVLENMGGSVNRQETLKDLLSCLDIRVFGVTYAGKINISIHGTCQITHGVNRFAENVIYTEQIMSPFRNPGENNTESTMTTLGTQSKLQEGHYVHHFSVNPKNIADDAQRVQSEGLLVEDIEKLKEALRKGASYYDSAAKAGTENELLLWVQLKEDSKAVLPSFVELVNINENREIDLQKVSDLLAKDHIKSEIEKIELYYNKGVTTIINAPEGAVEFEL
ncbi:MAG: hypothetical protein OHK0038_00540 [Flammeovirgaceae bacterium]